MHSHWQLWISSLHGREPLVGVIHHMRSVTLLPTANMGGGRGGILDKLTHQHNNIYIYIPVHQEHILQPKAWFQNKLHFLLLSYSVQLQRYEDWHFQCMLGYFVVSIIHRTLTWTTGSLTCVCDPLAYAYTRGASVYNIHPKDFCSLHRIWLRRNLRACAKPST